jgi:hypothetical protein
MGGKALAMPMPSERKAMDFGSLGGQATKVEVGGGGGEFPNSSKHKPPQWYLHLVESTLLLGERACVH